MSVTIYVLISRKRAKNNMYLFYMLFINTSWLLDPGMYNERQKHAGG